MSFLPSDLPFPPQPESEPEPEREPRRRLVIPDEYAHLRPTLLPLGGQGDTFKEQDPLPRADVVIVTWTSDEMHGLLRMLVPRIPKDVPDHGYLYTRDFHRVWPALQSHRVVQWRGLQSEGTPSMNVWRDGSRQNGAFGHFFKIRIGSLDVLLLRSELHLNTDGREQPLRTLIRQIIEDCAPRLLLSVGTAGGVDPDDELGDVIVSSSAAFFLGSEFSDASYNHTRYTSPWTASDRFRNLVETAENMPLIHEDPLVAPTPHYAAHMPARGFRPQPPPGRASCRMRISDRPILTTDFFEFGTTENKLNTYGSAVEMGDALVAQVCREARVPFGFVRNVSDPVIEGKLAPELRAFYAASTYYAVGERTSMNGAAVIWALVAAEAEDRARLDALAGHDFPVARIELPIRAPASRPAPKPFDALSPTPDEPRFEPLEGPRAPSDFADVKRWSWDAKRRKYVLAPSDAYLEWAPLPDTPRPILVVSHDDDTWQALRHLFFGPFPTQENEIDREARNEILYRRGFDRFQRERTLQRLVQMEHRESNAPSRQIRGSGRYRIARRAGRDDRPIIFFDIRASILDDESVELMDGLWTQLLDEARPELVLSVGTGHATTEALAPGSVVIANRARFFLTGDLGGYRHNGELFGSDHAPDPRYLEAARRRMRPVEWPALHPPNPAFQRVMPGPVQPAPSEPQIYPGAAPVVTAPRRVPLGLFEIPLFMTATPGSGLDTLGSVIETGDAVLARQCQEHGVPCSFIAGVAVPVLAVPREEERARYAEFFERWFRRQAAFHAALTAWAVLSGEVTR